eukprot:jgi/Ulvmu1/6387/UM003_0015.1
MRWCIKHGCDPTARCGWAIRMGEFLPIIVCMSRVWAWSSLSSHRCPKSVTMWLWIDHCLQQWDLVRCSFRVSKPMDMNRLLFWIFMWYVRDLGILWHSWQIRACDMTNMTAKRFPNQPHNGHHARCQP